MTSKILATVLALSLIGLHPQAHAETREIAVGVSDAFIPRTRAGNETVAVVNGVFPNGCYRWSRSTVTHVTANVHDVRTYAHVQSGLCVMVLVPFTRQVPLGRLQSGQHRVRFWGGDGTYMEKFFVVE